MSDRHAAIATWNISTHLRLILFLDSKFSTKVSEFISHWMPRPVLLSQQWRHRSSLVSDWLASAAGEAWYHSCNRVREYATGTAPCRSDRLATIDTPFHRRMKLPSPLTHIAQSLPVTMLPTKNSLKSFKSVLARSDWPSVLFGSPVCTLGFDTRVRRSITGGAGLCSVSTSSRSVVSSWDRCLSVNSLWGVIERCEPRLRPVFSWRSVKRLICYKKRPTSHVSRPGIVTCHVWTQSVVK